MRVTKITVFDFVFFGTISMSPLIAQEPDYSNTSKGSLIIKAWKAIDAKNYDLCIQYAMKCVQLYEAEAIKQQTSLSGFVDKNDPNQHVDTASLDAVGTALWLTGTSYRELGQYQKTYAAFRKLVQNFLFCQCRGKPSGYWKPALGAKRSIMEVEFLMAEQ